MSSQQGSQLNSPPGQLKLPRVQPQPKRMLLHDRTPCCGGKELTRAWLDTVTQMCGRPARDCVLAVIAAVCPGARHMAGKARQLRQTAMQAHAAAAAKIEHLQNDGRELGPLTLDLHGLHATEAVEAVSRRWGSGQGLQAPHAQQVQALGIS